MTRGERKQISRQLDPTLSEHSLDKCAQSDDNLKRRPAKKKEGKLAEPNFHLYQVFLRLPKRKFWYKLGQPSHN